MASLIEQAAQRLEQLRRAGITVPEPVELAAATSPIQSPAQVPATAAARTAPPAAVAATPLPEPQRPVSGQVSRRVELNLDQIGAGGIVTPGAPRSLLADQYRVIKRPLIANATGKGAATVRHANLIMVTSALSGEGKSFTSINLAMSIAAELDHTVLLVDADVARPAVLRMLGLPPGPGLLDVLQRKIDLPSAILRTNVDKLSLLPSGSPLPNATELLASEAMTELLDEIATRYPDRIVIFDSPPLLLTTESRVLATHMGQVVMIVRADHTLQSTVQQALATIEACPVKMMVLNQASGDSSGAYSAGYGYGYGYGFEQGSHKAAATPDKS